jgi:hypothetical protein
VQGRLRWWRSNEGGAAGLLRRGSSRARNGILPLLNFKTMPMWRDMGKLLPLLISCCALGAWTTFGDLLTVPGTANPWLAGMTNGFSESGGDRTPENSPVLFTAFSPGSELRFNVPDTDRAGFDAGSESGPDGTAGFFVPHGAELGVGEIRNSPANALLGVFLCDEVLLPCPGEDARLPDPLDFSGEEARNYIELRPRLKQPFFIGNGRTTNGTAQVVIAPAGSTRLFLGITDGSGWYNNTGAFHVDVTASGGLTYPLTLIADPETGGALTVSANPGINGQYAAGTEVTITAQPNADFYLQSWNGMDQLGPDGAVVTMTGPKTVTAGFAPMQLDSIFGESPFRCAFEFIEAFLSGDFGDLGFRPLTPRTITALASTGSTNLDLTLLRRLRDEVLSRSAEGQKIIDSFYQLSPELIYHLSKSQELRHLLVDAVKAATPMIADMVGGSGTLRIATNEVSAANALLTKLTQTGGVNLRSAIQRELQRIGALENFVGKMTAEARFVIANVELQLVAPRLGSDNKLEFTLTGISPTGALRLEGSPDLVHWQTLSQITATQLPATVQTDSLPSARQMYFRISEVSNTP